MSDWTTPGGHMYKLRVRREILGFKLALVISSKDILAATNTQTNKNINCGTNKSIFG